MVSKDSGNIMIVGVGGQGTLLASKLLGSLFIKAGYDVKVSEVHGMSQRGGSVVTYVRYNKNKVYSPIIDKGGADIILSFELLEAARYAEYLKTDGVIITNTQEINPMPVITGAASYPEDIISKIKDMNLAVMPNDDLSLALKAGSPKCVNLVLLGRLSKYFDFTREEWLSAIEESVPPKFTELNKKAFLSGSEA